MMPEPTPAFYAIPADAPHGSVRLASYGVVEVAPEASPEARTRAVHLRIIVSNESDATWTLDIREQRVELDGHGRSAPAFASANPGTPPPVVTIPPWGIRTADLFFPVPADLQAGVSLPAFDAVSRVETDEEVVTRRTPFSRLPAEPIEFATYDYGDAYYWAPPYWYNPLYPQSAFDGATALDAALVSQPIVVRQHSSHFVPRRGR